MNTINDLLVNWKTGIVDQVIHEDNPNFMFYSELIELFYCPDDIVNGIQPNYFSKKHQFGDVFDEELSKLSDAMCLMNDEEINKLKLNIKKSENEYHEKLVIETKRCRRLSLLELFDTLEQLNLVNLQSVVHCLVCIFPTSVSVERFFSKLKIMRSQNMLLKMAYECLFYCMDNNNVYFVI
ncbi:hypothetical protein EIN_125670 [Entamoeba invadens IP1]|uniref:Uncharacterized protein n=1 Tax=Entamoeba invadens IP1 TaxID=370355 RepID=A0A0A1U8I6_ENTIV|nr:hypothetical protein EIN_125670 [Entamoeba invadens IP1]ELP89383.1 hypothetical protein EIN_125670 [Entamoeba invadens IP1]|eukprot:XP_004256154.1 hypothetical protein EIN_125670 [Entamoeba invadens IP1]